VRLGLVGLRRAQRGVGEVLPPHERPQPGVAGQPLHEDVARALHGGPRVGHSLLLVAEREGPQLERLALLRRLRAVAAIPDPVGERLEPGLAGGEGAVPLLLAVGVVQVLQHVEVERPEDPLAQLRGERRVPLDRLGDDPLAREDPVEQLPGLERPPHRGLGQAAGGLLPEAGDEGHRRALEGEGRARPAHGDPGIPRLEPRVEGGRQGLGEGVGHGVDHGVGHAGRSKGLNAAIFPPRGESPCVTARLPRSVARSRGPC
jgi:hypothetical protein